MAEICHAVDFRGRQNGLGLAGLTLRAVCEKRATSGGRASLAGRGRGLSICITAV